MTFDIKKVAHLARIKINETEQDAMIEKLDKLMHMLDQLQQVDTTGVKPMANPLDQHQLLRTDAVTETDQHKLYQSLAPKVVADLYLVPQVIE